MKVLAISVRLESLISISDKAYKATAFNGSTAIIPKSQVFGYDYDVQKSTAYWISEWILKQKELQYSNKKKAWFDSESRERLPSIRFEHHNPEKKTPIDNTINDLKKHDGAT